MTAFWESVVASVVANLIYTLLIALVILLITSIVIKRGRRTLFSMMCIRPDGAVVRVYLSRLDVLRGGSKGTDGVLKVGFTGPALMQLEYEAALYFRRLLQDRFLDALPRPIRTLIQRRNPYLSRIDFQVDVAPDEHSYLSVLDYGVDSTIFLGSDVYNHAVRSIYRGNRTFVRFVDERTGKNFDSAHDDQGEPTFAVRTEDAWHVIAGRSRGREIGIIQRVTLDTGRRVLMCAGISASATHGAARFFCENWRALRKRFDEDDFLVVLAFRDQAADVRPVRPAEELPDLSRHRSTSRPE
ncbi:MAG: hypothetical protein M3279_11860 [Actinomycetota bacterium]|nr:hypothetical protein [Actinomycetota bacterium]